MSDQPTIDHFCEDCDGPATECWDYSDAPIPNPPPADWLCARCADARREGSFDL